MPHQAEDIWQNTPVAQRGGLESILLANWVDVKSEWDNPQLEEDFAKILKTREVVTRAIEPLRADKKLEVLWKLQFELSLNMLNC